MFFQRGAIYLATMIVLTFVSSAAADGPMRWRLAAGERFVVGLSQASATEAEIGGKAYRSRLQVGVRLAWRVIEIVDDETAVIEQTLSELTVAADLPGVEPVRYASTAQDQEPMSEGAKAVAAEFRPLLGKTVTLRLTPRGELLAPRGEAAGAGQGSAALTAEQVRQMLGRLLPPLPPEIAAPGAAWEGSHQHATLHGRVRIACRYVLRDRQTNDSDPLEIIDATYTFHAASKEQDVALTITDQENSGVFHFNPQAGRLSRGEIRQSLTMQVAVEEAQVVQKVTSRMSVEIQPAP